MKRLTLLVLMCITLSANSQDLSRFYYFDKPYEDDTYLDISLTFSFLRNPVAPYPSEHHLNGKSGDLSMRSIHYGLGESRFLYKHKLLFDLFLIVENQVNGDGSAYYRQVESSVTNGIIGWFSFGWNFISTDRLCMALGGNLNDYFLGNTYRIDTFGHVKSYEPQGYWFAAGPSLFADYALTDFLVLHSHFSYSIGYWRAVSLDYADTEINDAYPKPHVAGLNIQLQTRWGIYTGLDYTRLINRGYNPNKTTRVDILLGFKFPL